MGIKQPVAPDPEWILLVKQLERAGNPRPHECAKECVIREAWSRATDKGLFLYHSPRGCQGLVQIGKPVLASLLYFLKRFAKARLS